MIDILHYTDILLLILAFFYFSSLALYVLGQNFRSLVNRVFCAFMLAIAAWDLSILFAVANTNPDLALLFYRIPPLPGIILASLLLYFALIFPDGRDLSLYKKALIFSPAVFFGLATVFTDWLVRDFTVADPARIYFGARLHGPLYGLFVVNEIFYLVGGVVVAVVKAVRRSGIESKMSSLLALAFFVNGFTGFLFAVWLPRMGLGYLFSLGPLSVVFGASVGAYAIKKYKLFSIAPQLAAEEILDALAGSVFVCDLSGRRIYGRERGIELTEEQLVRISNRALERGALRNYRIIAGGKSLNVSAQFFKEGAGVVMVFYDLTEMEKEEDKETRIQEELEKRLDKERTLRSIFIELAKAYKPEDIERILASAGEVLIGYPEVMGALKSMASLTMERARLLSSLRRDKVDLENKLVQIEETNKEFVQRELKMIELKEKIRALKEANKQI